MFYFAFCESWYEFEYKPGFKVKLFGGINYKQSEVIFNEF